MCSYQDGPAATTPAQTSRSRKVHSSLARLLFPRVLPAFFLVARREITSALLSMRRQARTTRAHSAWAVQSRVRSIRATTQLVAASACFSRSSARFFSNLLRICFVCSLYVCAGTDTFSQASDLPAKALADPRELAAQQLRHALIEFEQEMISRAIPKVLDSRARVRRLHSVPHLGDTAPGPSESTPPDDEQLFANLHPGVAARGVPASFLSELRNRGVTAALGRTAFRSCS